MHNSSSKLRKNGNPAVVISETVNEEDPFDMVMEI